MYVCMETTNDGTVIIPFPGSTQLSIMCNKEKWERVWYLSSSEHDTSEEIPGPLLLFHTVLQSTKAGCKANTLEYLK